MNRKLYKVLVAGESCHGGSLKWSLPTKNPETGKYRPGAWQHVSGNVSMCSRGLHLTEQPEKWLKVGCEIFRAQPQECPTVWQDDKCVVTGARLLYPIRNPAYWTKVEEFCASIKDVPFLRPDGNTEPEWKLFTAPTWAAARAAAWAAAWDATRAAARAAARAAVWDAAWDAARSAAWDAARSAARSAAWAAAWAAAWDAARDAELMVSIAVCDGRSLDPKHTDHAKARWRVWQKGYGLLCDVNGTLYVYSAEASK